MGMVGWLEYDESRCVTIWTFTWGRAEALKSAEMILAFNESWFPHCACLSSEKKPYCHLSLVCEQDFWILKGWQWWGIQWYRVVRPSPTLHLSDCHNFRTPLGSPSDGSWWCSLLPACFHLMAHGFPQVWGFRKHWILEVFSSDSIWLSSNSWYNGVCIYIIIHIHPMTYIYRILHGRWTSPPITPTSRLYTPI